MLTKKAFVKIDAWFDKCESAEEEPAMAGMIMSPSGPSKGLFSAKSLSAVSPVLSEQQLKLGQLNDSVDEEDEDDGGDQKRREAVKGFLFDTYRVQNHTGIMLDDFVADLDFVFQEVCGSPSDERTLYQTLLNMPQ